MSIYKLPAERESRAAATASLSVTLQEDMYNLGDAIVRARAAQGCEFDLRQLPVHRRLRWSVRRKLTDFFDDLALDAAFVAHRAREGVVLLAAPGVFVHAQGHSKGSYSSCWFSLWAESRVRAEEVIAQLETIAAETRMHDETFTLDWQFTNSGGELRSASFQELADPLLLDEAYPSLGMPAQQFIARYLDASECVLILLGPPGTGKTRLVRAILSEVSRRKGENAEVMYTADKRALQSDEIFVEFITGSHDAFVIEDTDHLLKARTSGNEEMHRFLAIADGVARSQGRKIIFTTNLPNVTDIDDALVRPGRCFAVQNLRSLAADEALRLAGKICANDAVKATRAAEVLRAMDARCYSVAQVYRACI
ncbi:MAG: AAA family ATPase [Pseudomonadota bacterium]